MEEEELLVVDVEATRRPSAARKTKGRIRACARCLLSACLLLSAPCLPAHPQCNHLLP